MRRTFAVVAAVLMPSTVGLAPRPASAQEPRAAVAATWAEFKSAWIAGNARQAVAAFFTDDAINMVPGAASDSGRSAIQKSFTAFFAGNKVSEVSQPTDELHVVGRLAYERGMFIQTTAAVNGQPSVQRSRYLAIWLHQPDGKWRCSRFLFNELPQT